MKERHTITPEELDEWLRRPQWHAFARSFGAVSRKVLEIDGAASGGPPVFRVIDRDETRFIGTDKAAAITAYNDAP